MCVPVADNREKEFAMTFRHKINSSLLIDEVKKRPCLYDNRGAHGNHELKNAAWGEIGLAMFNEKWHEFPLADKDAMGKDVSHNNVNFTNYFSFLLSKIKSQIDRYRDTYWLSASPRDVATYETKIQDGAQKSNK